MTKEALAKLGIVIEKDEITEEEALALIEQSQNSLRGEVKKHKDLLSARNSEIADYKKKEADRMTDDEKNALHVQQLEEENKTLKRQNAINERVKDYVAIGYKEDLAKKIAEAEVDGKPTAQLHKEFITSREESIKAELMKDNPVPRTNGDAKPLTKEELAKMNYTELMKAKETNPELVDEFIQEQSKTNN